jgi:hypothetical protein
MATGFSCHLLAVSFDGLSESLRFLDFEDLISNSNNDVEDS